MEPFLVSALVGIGVKIVSDLLTPKIKKAFAADSTGHSPFSNMLDRARGATPANGATAASSTAPVTRLAAADQVPLRMADAANSIPSFGRAYGAASYHRMDIEAP